MTDNIIVDTATRIFADLCEPATVNAAEEGTWPTALWDALEESGLTLTWVPDTLGGAGAELLDGFAVLRAAGRANAPVPLAETLMAGWLLAQAGIEAPAGPMTIAPIHADGHIELADGTLRGRARQVPFARNAGHIVVLARRERHRVGGAGAGRRGRDQPGSRALPASRATRSRSTARVPPQSAPAAGIDMAGIVQFGAAVRAQQMAGALEHILDQSVQWSLDRVQFGRPIAKFQAVQHNLAQLAGEVAAAGAAADGAAEAIARHGVGNETSRGRGRDRQGPGRRGRRHRRRDRASGARRDGVHLRAFAAPRDAAPVVLARGIRQRGALGDTARPHGRGARRRRAVAVRDDASLQRHRDMISGRQ